MVGKDVDIAIALVSKLMQIAPCYYVTGNHEAWIDSKFSELEEKLLNENVQILHDQVIKLEKGGQTVQIVGLDDPDFKTETMRFNKVCFKQS